MQSGYNNYYRRTADLIESVSGEIYLLASRYNYSISPESVLFLDRQLTSYRVVEHGDISSLYGIIWSPFAEIHFPFIATPLASRCAQ